MATGPLGKPIRKQLNARVPDGLRQAYDDFCHKHRVQQQHVMVALIEKLIADGGFAKSILKDADAVVRKEGRAKVLDFDQKRRRGGRR